MDSSHAQPSDPHNDHSRQSPTEPATASSTEPSPGPSAAASSSSAGGSNASQANSSTSPQLTDMVSALAKTFAVAREDVPDERLARDLVYNAGRLAWRLREGGVQTEFKTSISDVVTDADRAAEQFVFESLTLLRPDDGILGEEGTEKGSTTGRFWVIDPVDGTYNFTRGSDYWCSAVALIESAESNPAQAAENPQRVVVGAVHRPAMGYTWVGGESIPTTKDAHEVTSLESAPSDPSTVCVATYLHPVFLSQEPIKQPWSKVIEGFASVRMMGSASVELASIADGEIGGWIQHSVKSWDWLPGRALVEGAGGVCRKVEAGGVVWSLAGSAGVVEAIEKALASSAHAADTNGVAVQHTNAGLPLPWSRYELADDLNLAWAMADAADSITLDRFQSADLKVESKPDLTPVSDADLDVEKALRHILSSERPGDAIVGEEFGGEVSFKGRQWVMDPIDGTKNFVRGVPVWATLISLLIDGKPVLGVVSAPGLGRRWVGHVGSSTSDGGESGPSAWTTYQDEPLRPISVSGVSDVADCSISISSLTGWKERGLRENLISLTDDAWRLRGFGDFYSYCLLAEGAVDVAAEPEVSVWDLAALVPIVEGAGGRFSSLDGVDGPHGGDAVATNGLLHGEVLKRLTSEADAAPGVDD